MTMTEFAMVEELAFLIKDNLSCKHLILSMEEILVNSLQDDSSSDGILELEPMSPYHRLLLHRLADIFGFAHESIGEGDERHLILQRCSDSSIPSVLVSDILLQYDEYQSPTTSTHILKRKDSSPASNLREGSFPALIPVEEREAAYLAARERIFSLHDDDEKEPLAPRPRSVPVVARRMIAHALGQQICPTSNSEVPPQNIKEGGPSEEPSIANKFVGHSNSVSKSSKNLKGSTSQEFGSHERKANGKGGKSSPVHFSHSDMTLESKPVRNGPGNSLQTGDNGRYVGMQNLEREQIGAARRMFAHALGLASTKSNQSC
uniref:R3H domain-containing protein 2 n=1 Tax=Anthurium amnicola TaxID=1678845 RepID=A0A1D1XHQ7_9ARAE